MTPEPAVIQRIMKAAEGAAALHQYPFPERRALWQARFSHNIPELQYLESLTDADGCQYTPGSATPTSLGTAPTAETGGMAATAAPPDANESSLTQASLQALELAERHSGLNAFIQLADKNNLRQQAAAAAHMAQRGTPMPLLGVPLAIKDLMAVKGFRRTGGSMADTTAAPCDHDALAVERLRRAGAFILGMANLHELAYGITSANPHYGAVVNPRGHGCIPGGSSGGSAAAVAAGIVRGALGTDTAGSIRIPAACCGVVGFKPSYEAIPRQGVMDLGPTLDHVGPITQSVNDAALLFSIMAGQPAQVPRNPDTLDGVRIGLPRRYFFEPLAPDVRHALESVIRKLRADGAAIRDTDIPGVEHSAAIQLATLCSEATAIHWRRLVDTPDSLGEDVRVRLEIGQFFPAIWYTRAQGARARLAAAMAGALADVDLLLTPTLRTTAPRSGAASVEIDGAVLPLHAAMTSLTLPFNLTGLPAISVPCGSGENGLPISLQLVGRAGEDWRVLAVAKRVEALLESAPAH